MPKVSVIVPNYNHARFLRQRIDSILAQTYQDFELILLDDCSTDESRSILEEYARDSRVRLEFNSANSGSTFKQWNKGVALARGKYVWIAESDDYADARFLERLVPVLEMGSEVALVFCRSWRVLNEDNNVSGFAEFGAGRRRPTWGVLFGVVDKGECERGLTRDNITANASSVVFRRRAYDDVGGADETLRTSGDWKVWAAMALAGRVGFVNEPLSYCRTHSGTVRGSIWGSRGALMPRYIQERFQVVDWILDRLGSGEDLRRGAYAEHCKHWGLAVVSLGFPLRVKREIIGIVREFDPHPVQRFLQGMPWIMRTAAWRGTSWICSKIVWAIRNYVWHPVLNNTRAIRHSVGLNRGNIRALLRRP
jgi:Glycosyl transferase family 2